jgi:hypothetical protein
METENTQSPVHPHRLTDPGAVLRFALAGNARLTLVSGKTGRRFTYRVRQFDPPDGRPTPHFVQVLTGADNDAAYSYLGAVFNRRDYRRTAKSKIAADAPSAKAWAWFWPRALAGALPTELEVWHEGRCGRCGRALTVPQSIETGFGPECASALGVRP